jgi:hypothetical protein
VYFQAAYFVYLTYALDAAQVGNLRKEGFWWARKPAGKQYVP